MQNGVDRRHDDEQWGLVGLSGREQHRGAGSLGCPRTGRAQAGEVGCAVRGWCRRWVAAGRGAARAHLSRVEILQTEQLPLSASATSMVVCTTLRALGPRGDVGSRDEERAGCPAASASDDSCGAGARIRQKRALACCGSGAMRCIGCKQQRPRSATKKVLGLVQGVADTKSQTRSEPP
jgi:hypothetical protein